MNCLNKLIQQNESDLQKNVTNPAMFCLITLPLGGKGRSLLEKLHYYKTSFVTLLKNKYSCRGQDWGKIRIGHQIRKKKLCDNDKMLEVGKSAFLCCSVGFTEQRSQKCAGLQHKQQMVIEDTVGFLPQSHIHQDQDGITIAVSKTWQQSIVNTQGTKTQQIQTRATLHGDSYGCSLKK